MKINVFDLTGQQCFLSQESQGSDDIKTSNRQALHPLLIYPKEAESNRTPYLQDPQHPELEDFLPQNGYFNYNNSFFLADILAGTLQSEKLHDFFAYQLGILDHYEPSAPTIILVPDDYNAEKQENLLRHCGLPRNRTMLLWRSVAICLGAEEELRKRNATAGARIAVVDSQSARTVNISILTLQCDQGKLVPARSAFRKRENYPVINQKTRQLTAAATNPEKEEFYRHTWQNSGINFVPDGEGSWEEYLFQPQKQLFLQNPYPGALQGIDFFIISGKSEIFFLQSLPEAIQIFELGDENFAARGAGRFAVRRENGLPTYFDECETLYFIVQDCKEEKILARPLIQGGELCRGGMRIEGEVNRDFFLEKDKDSISFLMHLGEITQNTPLKELNQSFGRTTSQAQPLTLYPSMIPGQGIAQVQVKASPLLREPIELDFLKMSEACYFDKRGRKHSKTMAYLQMILPRSFPIDFPDVAASSALYERYCEHDVQRFLEGKRMLPGDCFCHTTWPNAGAGGVEAFQRINVFGTQNGKEFPLNNAPLFRQLFFKIAERYKKPRDEQERRDCIRLAAWTYRCDCEIFRDIIKNSLDKMKLVAAGGNIKPVQQEFTVCANMLSRKQQEEFLCYFNQHAHAALKKSRKGKDEVKGVDWWIRAQLGILIYSNDVLRDIDSAVCEETMGLLLQIWKNYNTHGKTQAYISKVICCMLFLLRRRKYDHDFLRQDTSRLFADIMSLRENLLYSFPLALAFFEYMENNGSIDIPMGEIIKSDQN